MDEEMTLGANAPGHIAAPQVSGAGGEPPGDPGGGPPSRQPLAREPQSPNQVRIGSSPIVGNYDTCRICREIRPIAKFEDCHGCSYPTCACCLVERETGGTMVYAHLYCPDCLVGIDERPRPIRAPAPLPLAVAPTLTRTKTEQILLLRGGGGDKDGDGDDNKGDDNDKAKKEKYDGNDQKGDDKNKGRKPTGPPDGDPNKDGDDDEEDNDCRV